MAMLSEQLHRRGLTGADRDAFLFVDASGGPLRYENWRRRVWSPAAASAAFDAHRFHDLRRANATVMVAEVVDLKTAQRASATPIRASRLPSRRGRQQRLSATPRNDSGAALEAGRRDRARDARAIPS
jgi:hypothetical protein